MTSIMQDNQAFARASAPLTTGAIAVGLIGTALAFAAAAFHSDFAGNAFLWAALAGLSGVFAAPSEQGAKGTTAGLRLSMAVLGGNLLVARLAYDVRPITLVLASPLALVAVLAALLAPRLLSNRISAPRYLLTLWLAPALLIAAATTAAAILTRGKVTSQVCLGFSLASPFGPWATLLANAVSFPNAGEGFRLPLALVFTGVLGTLLYVIVSRPQKAAYCLIPFGWLLTAWYAIGLGTLASCME